MEVAVRDEVLLPCSLLRSQISFASPTPRIATVGGQQTVEQGARGAPHRQKAGSPLALLLNLRRWQSSCFPPFCWCDRQQYCSNYADNYHIVVISVNPVAPGLQRLDCHYRGVE